MQWYKRAWAQFKQVIVSIPFRTHEGASAQSPSLLSSALKDSLQCAQVSVIAFVGEPPAPPIIDPWPPTRHPGTPLLLGVPPGE